MLKPLNFKCYEVLECSEEIRDECPTYKKGASCWDHVDEHQCCDRSNWQRCIRCEVWLAAEKINLPEKLIHPKKNKNS